MATTKENLIDNAISVNPYYFGKLMAKCNGQVFQMASEIAQIAANNESEDPETCLSAWAENN